MSESLALQNGLVTPYARGPHCCMDLLRFAGWPTLASGISLIRKTVVADHVLQGASLAHKGFDHVCYVPHTAT